MRIVVFGGSGLLGSEIIRSLSTKGIEITVPKIRISSLSQLIGFHLSEGTDAVCNCIGMVGVEACENDKPMSKLLNHEFPARLATETNRLGLKLIHFSTPSVFSGESSPNTETDTPDSTSVYGTTKAFGDLAVLENDPSATILRLNFTSFRKSPETFAYKVFDSANHDRTFDAFSDVFFNPVDSEIVGDLCLRLFHDDMSGLFNLGSTMTISKYDFAREVYGQLGKDPNLVRNIAGSPISQSKFFSSNTSLDTQRLSSYLGEKSGEFLTLDFNKLKSRYFDYLANIKLTNR